MDSNFFALISRMRYIARWGLMRNALPENIQEHSHMVAVLAHALGVIRRDIFHEPCDVNALATAALYHDASEILTGDLPTPIKYHNAEIMSAYHAVEDLAVQKLLGMLPPELRATYADVLAEDKGGDIYPLVKAADKLSSASRSARPATTSFSPPRRRRARRSRARRFRRCSIFWSTSFPRSSAISTSSARSVNKEDNVCVQS